MSTIELIYVVITSIAGIYGIYAFGSAEYRKQKTLSETMDEEYADEIYFETLDKKF